MWVLNPKNKSLEIICAFQKLNKKPSLLITFTINYNLELKFKTLRNFCILLKDKRMIILYAIPISLRPTLGKENRYFYTGYSLTIMTIDFT